MKTYRVSGLVNLKCCVSENAFVSTESFFIRNCSGNERQSNTCASESTAPATVASLCQQGMLGDLHNLDCQIPGVSAFWVPLAVKG